jgi:hypothetical protein
MNLIVIVVMVASYVTSPGFDYENSVYNPENREYVEEIAFNEEIAPEAVTQTMFNERYLDK